MAIVDNKTGAPHFWFEQTGPEGERLDVLVVRATFDFSANGESMTLAHQQQPVALGDTFSGAVNTSPLRAVVKDDGDLLPYKPGTDILLSGAARAPDGKARPSWLASVSVGPINKTLRLHGPRQFRKGLFGWNLGPGEPVTRVPLDYRLAYGGCIDVPAELTKDGNPDFIKHSANPAGCGWLPASTAFKHLPGPGRKHLKKWIAAQKVLEAPQIESVSEPIKSPYQDIAAQGFGAIARWWEPRLSRQGSYDDQWRKERYPLLPKNFGAGFYQCALPDLVCTPHLIGNETVLLVGLLPTKCEMRLPGWRLVAVVTRASGESAISLPVLDTVRMDLDSKQASLVWRAHFDGADPVTEIALAATTASIDGHGTPAAVASAAEII